MKIIQNLPLPILILSICLAKNISVQETYGPTFKSYSHLSDSFKKVHMHCIIMLT